MMDAPTPAATPSDAAATAPSFAALGLSAGLVERAAALGWAVPTAVQSASLPLVKAGGDVLAIAPTGTGKTGAFLLPALDRLLAAPDLDARPRRLRLLVLAPTRELAAQTGKAVRSLAPALRSVVVVGGLSANPQMMALRGGAHVLVATPGRLLDLVAQNAVQLGHVQTLVLDEADKLVDLGFADEVGRVIALLPPRRQTLLFSATLRDAVDGLANAVLREPARVQVAAGAEDGIGRIVQRAVHVDTAQRTPLLRHLITSNGWRRTLVFVATQYATEHVADKLRQAGLPAAALHGGLSVGRRAQVLADLHQGALAVLAATDLAARGLDIPGLDAVVSHDLPRSPDDHTHRIGRTARAGQAGVALSFVAADAPGSEAHFRLIEQRTGRRVPRERVPGFEPAADPLPTPAGAGTGGVKGRRKSRKDKLREAAAAAAAPPRRR